MKKKIKRKLAAAVGIISLLLGVYQVNAAEGGCDVEQILLHMPEVTMYYRASEPEESYEAYLDGKALEYSSTALFKETGEGVDYYLMLDVSASIPRDKFENIKNGIRKFISEMRENDKCILLTFGNESKVVLNGTEGSERAETLIQELKNEDMETVLFQSIVQSAEMIEKAAQTEEKRRVIVTITDGEDCVTGQATASEALRTLNDKGIPLFAMAVDVGKQEYINSFGEFARNTGGTLNIYAQGDSSIVFDSIKNTVENSFVAYFRNDTNIAENKRTDFTVKFLEHQTMKNREVIPSRWIPDKDAPTVKEVKPQGENELVLIFSEPVLGADVQGNYRIEKDEKAIATGSVSYSKEKMRTVLTFEKPLYSGDYTIFFSGITDNSMEKNPLKESKTFHLEGAEEPKEEKESRFEKWWWMLPVGCVLLLPFSAVLSLSFTERSRKTRA